jgi:hypothetical protein
VKHIYEQYVSQGALVAGVKYQTGDIGLQQEPYPPASTTALFSSMEPASQMAVITNFSPPSALL